MSSDLIPFEIETQRVVQLLAKQIYQSPLALLRENTQNAFDAIRQRLHRNDEFEPSIEIALTPDRIVVSDNGIGMTPQDLQRHYWTAGSSSKNNDAARAAGVVGTFGIGAMANFGIADRLTVETESAVSGERTVCRADRARLDLKENCIEREIVEGQRRPGTTVTAHVESPERISVRRAREYIADFVSLLDLPVRVNGETVSQQTVESVVAPVPDTWSMTKVKTRVGSRMTCDVKVILSNNADVWLRLENMIWDCRRLSGKAGVALRSVDVANIPTGLWVGRGIGSLLVSVWWDSGFAGA